MHPGLDHAPSGCLVRLHDRSWEKGKERERENIYTQMLWKEGGAAAACPRALSFVDSRRSSTNLSGPCLASSATSVPSAGHLCPVRAVQSRVSPRLFPHWVDGVVRQAASSITGHRSALPVEEKNDGAKREGAIVPIPFPQASKGHSYFHHPSRTFGRRHLGTSEDEGRQAHPLARPDPSPPCLPISTLPIVGSRC